MFSTLVLLLSPLKCSPARLGAIEQLPLTSRTWILLHLHVRSVLQGTRAPGPITLPFLVWLEGSLPQAPPAAPSAQLATIARQQTQRQGGQLAKHNALQVVGLLLGRQSAHFVPQATTAQPVQCLLLEAGSLRVEAGF